MKSRDHVTDGYDCWCQPRFLLPCDECAGVGCWKCTNGYIELSREDAGATPMPIIVAHRPDKPAMTLGEALRQTGTEPPQPTEGA